jgi:transposase
VGILVEICGVVKLTPMTSTEFYRHILGLESPWSVSNVDLDMTANRVVIRVEIDRTTKWFHPETQEPATVHKWTDRRWRHLDTCQFETIIEASVPSVKYRDGKIEEVAVPWADRYQRFTKLMEQAVIIWLRACGNVDKVAATMRLDWQTVNRIMERAVERGLLRREDEIITKAGVDEKSFRRGHVYASILNDLDNNRVWDLVEGRTTQNAKKLFETLSEEQREGVEAVAMDMWAAFENAATELLPNADIVHDKFHVSAHLNKAVDDVRKEEHRELMSAGDDTLKKSKYLWLRNFPDLRCEPSFQELYTANLRTSKAWRFKEAFAAFWDYIYQAPAEKFFKDWHRGVKRSQLEPLKKVADMLANRLWGLLNYLKHRITNAASEGMNSLVARVIANARGLRTFRTLRVRVLFFLGKLDLTV